VGRRTGGRRFGEPCGVTRGRKPERGEGGGGGGQEGKGGGPVKAGEGEEGSLSSIKNSQRRKSGSYCACIQNWQGSNPRLTLQKSRVCPHSSTRLRMDVAIYLWSSLTSNLDQASGDCQVVICNHFPSTSSVREAVNLTCWQLDQLSTLTRIQV
jgi:hypothetical protein